VTDNIAAAVDQILDLPVAAVANTIISTFEHVDSPTQDISSADDDFEFARRNLRDVIEKARPALNSAIDFANTSESPRAFEAVSGIIDSLTTSSSELVKLHRERAETRRVESTGANRKDSSSNTSVHVDRAIFVGSTAELQKLIGARRPQ